MPTEGNQMAPYGSPIVGDARRNQVVPPCRPFLSTTLEMIHLGVFMPVVVSGLGWLLLCWPGASTTTRWVGGGTALVGAMFAAVSIAVVVRWRRIRPDLSRGYRVLTVRVQRNSERSDEKSRAWDVTADGQQYHWDVPVRLGLPAFVDDELTTVLAIRTNASPWLLVPLLANGAPAGLPPGAMAALVRGHRTEPAPTGNGDGNGEGDGSTAAASAPPEWNGTAEHAASLRLRLVAAIAAAVGLFFTAITAAAVFNGAESIALLVVGAMAMAPTAVAWVMERRVPRRVRIDESGIRWSAWVADGFVPWSDVADVTVSNAHGRMTLRLLGSVAGIAAGMAIGYGAARLLGVDRKSLMKLGGILGAAAGYALGGTTRGDEERTDLDPDSVLARAGAGKASLRPVVTLRSRDGRELLVLNAGFDWTCARDVTAAAAARGLWVH